MDFTFPKHPIPEKPLTPLASEPPPPPPPPLRPSAPSGSSQRFTGRDGGPRASPLRTPTTAGAQRCGTCLHSSGAGRAPRSRSRGWLLTRENAGCTFGGSPTDKYTYISHYVQKKVLLCSQRTQGWPRSRVFSLVRFNYYSSMHISKNRIIKSGRVLPAPSRTLK